MGTQRQVVIDGVRYIPMSDGESRSATVYQQDVRNILLALGLGDHARPISTHAVIYEEIIPEILRLRERLRYSMGDE